jgi:hypothetical protein
MKIDARLKESPMQKTLAALIAVAILASSSAVPTAEARDGRAALGLGKWPAYAPPGYVNYPYGEPLPGPNCYWYRMPVYDPSGNMIGWRGLPQAFCYWLSGYRPWP